MSDLFQYSNQKLLVEDYFVEGYNLEFNYRILSELTEFTLIVDISEKRLKFEEKKDDKGQSLNLTPLDFFNLLYHEYDFIVENKLRPLSIIPRLKGISLSFFDRLYFYVKLSELLYLTNDHTLTFIGNLINIEYSRVLNGFFGDNLINEIDVISDEDKNAIIEHAKTIEDVEDRLMFLIRVKHEIVSLKPTSSDDKDFIEKLEAKINFNKEINTINLRTRKSEQEDSEEHNNDFVFPKILVDEEYVDIVFDSVSSFFPSEEHDELYNFLSNGEKSIGKFTFLGSAIKLADAFKKLHRNKIISPCRQKDLEGWLVNNFQYLKNKKVSNIEPSYATDLISTNKYICKTPIIDIEVDKSTGKRLIF